jgi:hypothetical protein
VRFVLRLEIVERIREEKEKENLKMIFAYITCHSLVSTIARVLAPGKKGLLVRLRCSLP